MNISTQEKLMYSVMKAIYDIEISKSFIFLFDRKETLKVAVELRKLSTAFYIGWPICGIHMRKIPFCRKCRKTSVRCGLSCCENVFA